MKHEITIINPTPPAKIKRLKKRKTARRKKRVLKRKKVLLKNSLIKKTKKGVSKMAVKNKKSTRAKKKTHRNPKAVTYTKNRKRYSARRRGRSRKLFKNPFDAVTGARTTDLLVSGAGAAAGGIATPWLGNIFQLQGMVKYAAQVGIALALYYVFNKIGMRKAAVPAAAGGIAVTAYQFAQENNILAGLGNDYISPGDQDIMNNIASSVGAIPYDQNLLSAVPFEQPLSAIPLNQMAGGGGYDDDTFNADYY